MRPIKPTDTVLDSVAPGVRREVQANNAVDKPSGVWIVAGIRWDSSGPAVAIPQATEIDALRVVNASEHLRAYFVPFDVNLREAMAAWPDQVVVE